MFWYILILLALVGADQGLKYWITQRLAIGESCPFLPGIIRFTRLHNYGAAFSSLTGKTVILLVVTTILMVAVAVLLARKVVRHPLGVAACLLILGGGLGNYIDRICRGYVVDMFDLQFMNYAIFNLADCFVVVGAILGAVYYLWIYEKCDKKDRDDKNTAGDN